MIYSNCNTWLLRVHRVVKYSNSPNGERNFFLVIYREIRLCGSIYVGSAHAHKLPLQDHNFYCHMQIIGIARHKKFHRDLLVKALFDINWSEDLQGKFDALIAIFLLISRSLVYVYQLEDFSSKCTTISTFF